MIERAALSKIGFINVGCIDCAKKFTVQAVGMWMQYRSTKPGEGLLKTLMAR